MQLDVDNEPNLSKQKYHNHYFVDMDFSQSVVSNNVRFQTPSYNTYGNINFYQVRQTDRKRRRCVQYAEVGSKISQK